MSFVTKCGRVHLKNSRVDLVHFITDKSCLHALPQKYIYINLYFHEQKQVWKKSLLTKNLDNNFFLIFLVKVLVIQYSTKFGNNKISIYRILARSGTITLNVHAPYVKFMNAHDMCLWNMILENDKNMNH